MIAFFDTSALMKLFVTEQHSKQVRAQAQASQRLLVSNLAWVEMLAALALKQRTQQINQSKLDGALAELEEEWPRYFQMGVDADLVKHAGQLALRFGLRAYDSVQLASAHRAQQQVGALLLFSCFDKQLNVAAQSLGLNAAFA